MRDTVDMFEEEENRRAFQALLDRKVGKDGWGIKYQTPIERLRDKFIEKAAKRMVDNVADFETALKLYEQMDDTTIELAIELLEKDGK